MVWRGLIQQHIETKTDDRDRTNCQESLFTLTLPFCLMNDGVEWRDHGWVDGRKERDGWVGVKIMVDRFVD